MSWNQVRLFSSLRGKNRGGAGTGARYGRDARSGQGYGCAPRPPPSWRLSFDAARNARATPPAGPVAGGGACGGWGQFCPLGWPRTVDVRTREAVEAPAV